MKHVVIYCDGACQGNPGPGAVAYRIKVDGEIRIERVNPFPETTTNQRMELTAAIESLIEVSNMDEKPESITVYSDSHYLVEGMNSWIATWMKNGWRNSKKKPVENQDLWLKLKLLSSQFKIDWIETRGHADDKDNNFVDELAREAAQGLKLINSPI